MTQGATLQIPRAIGAAAEAVAGARDELARMLSTFTASPVPMIMVDDDRRYVHVNPPALLAFRTGLEEVRGCRIDDLTPPYLLRTLEQLWERLLDTGHVTGRYDVANRDGTRLQVVFCAMRAVVPGLHLVAFAPQDWSDLDLGATAVPRHETRSPLTRREIELLQLAAQGRTGPRIAEELSLSLGTVKKHFENIYAKLGVRDRAAAVAKAMRDGLID